MALQQITMSYPKPRSTQRKIIPFARTDSSTVRCVLPKDAIITDVTVIQSTPAVTNSGAVSVGWAGATTAVLNAFSLPVSTVGMAIAGGAAGATVLAGTKLDSDKTVLTTYTVGSSTAGGVGFVVIEYFVAGPGEDITD
jgi:hypothetical protein